MSNIEQSQNPKQHEEACANGTTCFVLLAWLCGTIIIGKPFTYLHLGPVFITEIVLALLILNNLKRFNFSDLCYLGALAFYLTIGSMRHGDLFFAGKDMAWFYFLLFFRFFPRNFPTLYIRVVLGCSIIVAVLVSVSYLVVDYDFEKYRACITFFFIYSYFMLRMEGKNGIILALFFILLSYLVNFKASMILGLFLPVLMRYRNQITRVFTPRRVIILALFGVAFIYLNFSDKLMYALIYQLNFFMSFFGTEKTYSLGTALWRTEIWVRSLQMLINNGQLILGEFPGHNFINSELLGTTFYLEGSDQLGVLRSAHNILVQIVMKTGCLGLVLWVAYYFRCAKDHFHPIMVIFQIGILLMALSADILEVPSRGPLFYCYIVIMGLVLSRQIGDQGYSPVRLST